MSADDKRGYRFVVVPTKIVFDNDVSHAEFRVVCALASYTNEDEWVYPSTDTLGERLGITGRAVRKHLTSLVKRGYLATRKRYREDGLQTSSYYRVVADLMDEPPNQGPGTPGSNTPATVRDVPAPAERDVPAPQEPWVPTNETQGNETQGSLLPESERVPSIADEAARIEAEFTDEVWKPYPRHAKTGERGGGGNRKGALKLYRKLPKADRELVRRAVPNYAKRCAMANAWPKYLETFLNQRLWEQYQQAPTPPRQPSAPGGRPDAEVYVDADGVPRARFFGHG